MGRNPETPLELPRLKKLTYLEEKDRLKRDVIDILIRNAHWWDSKTDYIQAVMKEIEKL